MKEIVIVRQSSKPLSHVEGMSKIRWGLRELWQRFGAMSQKNSSVFVVCIETPGHHG